MQSHKRKVTPSDHYQHIFKEILVEPRMLRNNTHGLYESDTEEEKQRKDLRMEAWDLLMEKAYPRLTERQKQVFNLYFLEGMSQVSIAEDLDITQPSVHKTIYGNQVYTSKDEILYYGGIVKKLAKIIARDEELSAVINKLGLDLKDAKVGDRY